MMKHLTAGLIMLCLSACVFAQHTLSKEQLRDFKEADTYCGIKDYRAALGMYTRLLETDSANPELNFKAGYCLFQLGKNKLDALPYFRRAYRHKHPEASFFIAQCLHLQEAFEKAVKYYLIYKNNPLKKMFSNDETDRQIDITMRAEQFEQHPVDVIIKNIGPPINSEYPEYVPLITGKQDELIFTSRRKGSTGGKLDPYNDFFEDIYISKRRDNRWSKPRPLRPGINTDTHDACVGVSSDGKLLLIYRTNEEQTGGDLYWSERKDSTWTLPVKFGPEINTPYQEPSATITDDGTVMYFSSNRPGGFGGKDIYRIVKFSNGDWSLPLNLGPIINTAYDDDAPFIHPDGKTLYFSSKGHQTIGGYDIFSSELGDDGLWSMPVNLGYPINTVDDDIYFSLSADKKTGYYSSGRIGGYGRQDIYVLDMPDVAKLLSVMKGRVFGKGKPGEQVKAKLTLIDESSHSIQGIYRPNPQTGKYIMIFQPEKHYKLIVEAAEYATYTESIMLPRQEPFTEVNKDIALLPLRKQTSDALETTYKYSYTLENVYFDTEEHELLPESYKAFSSLIRAMLNNKNMVIEIAGYTDDTGDEAYNLNLSQKRAESVRRYLETWGISPERLIAKGYGESQLSSSSHTEQARAMNRRTEIRVIKE